MKVEKSKISEWIKKVKRVTISTGTCACGTGAGEMLEGSRGGMAVLWANDPKLRLAFQEFEEYSEMIRFAVEKAFFSWMIKGHAGGNETSCKANQSSWWEMMQAWTKIMAKIIEKVMDMRCLGKRTC